MKNKLAIFLAAVLGFAVTTVVFAQEAVNGTVEAVQNTEVVNAENIAPAEENVIAPAEANTNSDAPAAEAPAAGPAAY